MTGDLPTHLKWNCWLLIVKHVFPFLKVRSPNIVPESPVLSLMHDGWIKRPLRLDTLVQPVLGHDEGHVFDTCSLRHCPVETLDIDTRVNFRRINVYIANRLVEIKRGISAVPI